MKSVKKIMKTPSIYKMVGVDGSPVLCRTSIKCRYSSQCKLSCHLFLHAASYETRNCNSPTARRSKCKLSVLGKRDGSVSLIFLTFGFFSNQMMLSMDSRAKLMELNQKVTDNISSILLAQVL